MAFGSMSDQNSLAPETVVSGPVWNMQPTIDYVLKTVGAGAYTAQDPKDFSMMGKGGAELAPLHDFEKSIDPKIWDMVSKREQDIKDGLFRVDINENTPENAVLEPEATPAS